MSKKKTLLSVGLAALGVTSGLAALRAEGPGGSPAPTGSNSSPSAAAPVRPAQAVLLLSDGRILKGYLSEGEKGYLLKVKGGELPIARSKVEKIGGSIEEIYRYKLERLPERDPDERMKLVHWCLTNHLNDQAREQLRAILEVSPSSVEAKRMVAFLEADEDRKLFVVDTEVRRASVEVASVPAERAVKRAAKGEFAGVGLPTIFDLPTPLAVKRAEEFNRGVHPILQAKCAGCHNERYQGSYQLLRTRDPRDLSPTVLRANLEATLRLIDPSSPSRSDLLSSGLVPHGGRAQRPIFAGPADPSYRRLSAWVNSLRAPGTREESAPGRFGAPASPGGDGEAFASSRIAPAASAPLQFSPTPAARPATTEPTDEVIPSPPGQLVPGSGAGMQPYAPPDAEFPAPYLMGGPKPKPGSTPAGAPVAAPANNAANNATTAAPKAPSKPVKMDPALLEKALMNRYATPQ